MSGPSNVIVLDPDLRAGRQVQLGFAREGIPTVIVPVPADLASLRFGDNSAPALVLVGGSNGRGPALVRRARELLSAAKANVPVIVTGGTLDRPSLIAAGADEVVAGPLFLRDVVTLCRILRNVPAKERHRLGGSLAQTTGVYTLVRALCALGRSAVLTLMRGLRRGEIRFYQGEVTSAQVGLIHGQAALHQLLLWTDARFDYSREDVVRRQQIPLSLDELFADAERFLESVRESAGPLSPSTILEQDVKRVKELGKEIPTEVHGVLRMFDGHRVLTDILEDSPYRVFETLRVTNKALEAGLLKLVDAQRPKASWKAVLAIDEWLVGSETRDSVVERTATIDSGPAADGPKARTKGSTKRRSKQDGAEAPVERQTGIDWGALVPRTIGVEVGQLSQVVPAVATHGEVELKSRDVEREKLEALMDTDKRDKIFPRDIGLEPKIIIAVDDAPPPPARTRAASSDGEDWDKVMLEAKAKADAEPASDASSKSASAKKRRRTAPVIVAPDVDVDVDLDDTASASAAAVAARATGVSAETTDGKSKRVGTPAKGGRTRTPPKGVALPTKPPTVEPNAAADGDAAADDEAALWAEAKARAEAAEAAEKVAAEKAAADKAAAERIAAEKAEAEKAAAEKAAAERVAAEKAAADKAAAERVAAEKAAADKAAAERIAAERIAAEKAEAERIAAEKAAADKAAADKAAAEKAEAERIAAEKAAAEKAEAERIAAEKAEAERIAAERIAAEKAAAEKAEAERIAAEKAAADKAAADKAAADKAEAERINEREAEERAARAEAEYLAAKAAAKQRAVEEKAEAKRRSDPAIATIDSASTTTVDAGHSTTTRATDSGAGAASAATAATASEATANTGDTAHDSTPALTEARSPADEARAYAARVKAAAEARRRGDSGTFEKAPERPSLDAQSLVKHLVDDAIPPDEQMTSPVPRIDLETTTPFVRASADDTDSTASEPSEPTATSTATDPAPTSVRAHLGEPITVAETAGTTVAVADVVTVKTADDTANIVASPRVLISEDPAAGVQASPARVGEHVIQAAHATSVNAAPVATDDAPSDGIIRSSSGESESARAARLRQVLPPNPPAHDGPEIKEATGEIGSAPVQDLAAPASKPATSEPSVLIADLQAAHAVAATHASDKKPAHPVDAATASRELEVQETRRDAVAFTEDEEAFFRRAESHTHSVPKVESFDDLDEGYEPPPSFWERVFGKKKK